MSALRLDGIDASGLSSLHSLEGGGIQSDPAKEVPSLAFGKILDGVAAQANAASDQSEAFARGALDDIHGTMIAVKQAEISVKLVGSIRNKLLDAFQELWRTNV